MKRKKKKNDVLVAVSFLFAEFIFFIFLISLFPSLVIAVVGEGNVTVHTTLEVGNAAPQIVNFTLLNGDSLDLTPNSTTTATFLLILMDFNGESDIANLSAEFFDNTVSAYGDGDDNNYHYTNSSCFIDTGYGNSLEANATCVFEVEYYANNATWNISALATDTDSLQDFSSDVFGVNTLLALGLPDSIDYGEVNSTEVSSERTANVTNFGNVLFNLTLSGYGVVEGDGLAMNCSLGNNISVNYEKYNLTSSNTSVLNLSEFESIYRNLSDIPVTRTFNLGYRQNDVAPYTDDTNSTFWRIYVPAGSGGGCSGNIIFGSVIAAES